MSEYIVSVKKGLSAEQYKEAEKHITDQGGEIVDTFDREGIAPGFVVKHKADLVSTFQKGPHVEAIEPNGTVKTQ